MCRFVPITSYFSDPVAMVDFVNRGEFDLSCHCPRPKVPRTGVRISAGVY